MEDFEYSSHARDMLAERKIEEKWVHAALQTPERTESRDDKTMHYLKSIGEKEGRYLRVVVDVSGRPRRIITVFFDRRLGRKL